MRSVMMLSMLLIGCGSWFSGYNGYCEEYVDCLDGNEADENACVLENQEAERLAKVYGCTNDFEDYTECMMDEGRCEAMGPVDYWTTDGDCDDDYADYLDCLSDESDLMGTGAGTNADTGIWNDRGNGGSDGTTGSGGGSGSTGADSEEPIRDSCSFGSDICIETNEPDNASWCITQGGNYRANECSTAYQGSCTLPVGLDYTAEATAYYYNGFNGMAACDSAGGTYTPR